MKDAANFDETYQGAASSMFLNLNEEEKQNLYKSGVFSLGDESIIGRQHSFNEK